ncbi:MAG: hypothetical protein RI923_1441 [Pseudomonadota bacterium]|jgi:hypothetical protein
MEGLAFVLQAALQGARADPHLDCDAIAGRLAIGKTLNDELADHQRIARGPQLRHALFRRTVMQNGHLCIGAEQWPGNVGFGEAQGQMRCIENREYAEGLGIQCLLGRFRVHEFDPARQQIRAGNPAQEFERAIQGELMVLPLDIDDARH